MGKPKDIHDPQKGRCNVDHGDTGNDNDNDNDDDNNYEVNVIIMMIMTMVIVVKTGIGYHNQLYMISYDTEGFQPELKIEKFSVILLPCAVHVK